MGNANTHVNEGGGSRSRKSSRGAEFVASPAGAAISTGVHLNSSAVSSAINAAAGGHHQRRNSGSGGRAGYDDVGPVEVIPNNVASFLGSDLGPTFL